MISEEKLTAPLPWLAGLVAFVWLSLVVLQLFAPVPPLRVESVATPAPAKSPVISN